MTLDLNIALGPLFELNIQPGIAPIELTIVNNSGPSLSVEPKSSTFDVNITKTDLQLTIVKANSGDDPLELTVNQPPTLELQVAQNVPPTYNLEITKPQPFTLVAGIASSGLGSGGSSTGTIDLTITAGVFLAAYRAVTIEGFYTQQNEDSLSRYAGVTREPINVGNPGVVVKEGLITNNGWSWTPGLPIYATTNGMLTQTLPQFPPRRIGYAVSATEINLDPFPFLELSSNQW